MYQESEWIHSIWWHDLLVFRMIGFQKVSQLVEIKLNQFLDFL